MSEVSKMVFLSPTMPHNKFSKFSISDLAIIYFTKFNTLEYKAIRKQNTLALWMTDYTQQIVRKYFSINPQFRVTWPSYVTSKHTCSFNNKIIHVSVSQKSTNLTLFS